MAEEEKRLGAIAPGMQVVTSDGELLGTVEQPKSDGFMLRRLGGADPNQNVIPEMWVERIDEQVHLNRTGAEAVAGWKSLQFRTSEGARPGVPDTARETEPRGGSNWLVWLLVAAVALVAVLILVTQLGD